MLALHTATHQVEEVSHGVAVPARGGVVVRADALFDGFRDLTYAYGFGPRAYDLVTAELVDLSGAVVARADYLPAVRSASAIRTSGFRWNSRPADGGVWLLSVSSRRFAAIHLGGRAGLRSRRLVVPSRPRDVRGRSGWCPRRAPTSPPRGRVRALNSAAHASFAP